MYMSAMPTDPPRRAFAVYSEFTRTCLRCKRRVGGHSYRTFYGVFVDFDGTRVPASGEALHDVCPAHDAKPRVPAHNADEFWGEETVSKRRRIYTRTEKTVETGIMLQSNGRYAVRFNQKRLGTYETIDLARTARDNYIKQKGQTNGQQQKRK